METCAHRVLRRGGRRRPRSGRSAGGRAKGAEGADSVWSFSCDGWSGRSLLGTRIADMVPDRLRGVNEHGVTMAELLVVVAIVGVVSAVATPYFMRYMQSAALKAAAQELAAVISSGRQLAIARNTTVCVALSGNQALFKSGVLCACHRGMTTIGALT